MEKVKKVTLFRHALCNWSDSAALHRPDSGSRKKCSCQCIPVLICGLILGWQYGLAVGFLLPLVRSVLFGMPVLYPNAIAMAFEMGTYGLVAGWLYGHAKWQCTKTLYRSLVGAMISGRVVWAFAEVILLGMTGTMFTWEMFLAGAFLNAIPGIILQLVLIPVLMVALKRAKVVPFRNRKRGGNGRCKRLKRRSCAASILWRERTPAMNGWKHTTI